MLVVFAAASLSYGLLWGGSATGMPCAAPLGASTVVMLAIPQSQFARPIAVLASNFLAATSGVIASHLFQSPIVSAATALAVTGFLSARLGVLHPPSAGIALIAASKGPVDIDAATGLILGVGLLQSIVIVAAASAFNTIADRLKGRLLPVRGTRPPDRDPV